MRLTVCCNEEPELSMDSLLDCVVTHVRCRICDTRVMVRTYYGSHSFSPQLVIESRWLSELKLRGKLHEDTIRNHLRRFVERRFDWAVKPIPPLPQLRSTEWSTQFEKLMRNRLLMGAFRYGLFKDPTKGQYDCIPSVIRRAKKYQESGNDELLVDIANLAMVEFVHGRHAKKHFKAQDNTEEHCRPCH